MPFTYFLKNKTFTICIVGDKVEPRWRRQGGQGLTSLEQKKKKALLHTAHLPALLSFSSLTHLTLPHRSDSVTEKAQSNGNKTLGQGQEERVGLTLALRQDRDICLSVHWTDFLPL